MKIEKERFFDLLANTDYCEYKFESLYLEVLAENLRKATGIYFSAGGHQIKADSIKFSISERDFGTYDDLVRKVEEFLGSGDERTDKQLRSEFDWVKSYFWYNADKKTITSDRWATDNNLTKGSIFEVIYYVISGEYHKNLAFANELSKKYLVSEPFEAFFGKVVIPELDSLEFTFQKNGGIKIKGMSDTEWSRLDHLFTLLGNKY